MDDREGADGRDLSALSRRRWALNRAVFEWCLRRADRSRREQAIEAALQWSRLAAKSAVHHPDGRLASPALEGTLVAIAARMGRSPAAGRPDRVRRWLHVVDSVHAIGGHTALIERCVRFDPDDGVHHLVRLEARNPVPDGLAVAVAARGGGRHHPGRGGIVARPCRRPSPAGLGAGRRR